MFVIRDTPAVACHAFNTILKLHTSTVFLFMGEGTLSCRYLNSCFVYFTNDLYVMILLFESKLTVFIRRLNGNYIKGQTFGK